jgi:hypothetical protein
MTPASPDSPTPIPPAASRVGAAQVTPIAAPPPRASRHGHFSPTPRSCQRFPAGGDAVAVTARNAQIRAGIGASAPPLPTLSP